MTTRAHRRTCLRRAAAGDRRGLDELLERHPGRTAGTRAWPSTTRRSTRPSTSGREPTDVLRDLVEAARRRCSCAFADAWTGLGRPGRARSRSSVVAHATRAVLRLKATCLRRRLSVLTSSERARPWEPCAWRLWPSVGATLDEACAALRERDHAAPSSHATGRATSDHGGAAAHERATLRGGPDPARTGRRPAVRPSLDRAARWQHEPAFRGRRGDDADQGLGEPRVASATRKTCWCRTSMARCWSAKPAMHLAGDPHPHAAVSRLPGCRAASSICTCQRRIAAAVGALGAGRGGRHDRAVRRGCGRARARTCEPRPSRMMRARWSCWARSQREDGAIAIGSMHGTFGVARDLPTNMRAADVFRQRLELARLRAAPARRPRPEASHDHHGAGAGRPLAAIFGRLFENEFATLDGIAISCRSERRALDYARRHRLGCACGSDDGSQLRWRPAEDTAAATPSTKPAGGDAGARAVIAAGRATCGPAARGLRATAGHQHAAQPDVRDIAAPPRCDRTN